MSRPRLSRRHMMRGVIVIGAATATSALAGPNGRATAAVQAPRSAAADAPECVLDLMAVE
jgi:hypothetical protein